MKIQKELLDWLREDACPLWSTCGVDRVSGGFQEMLNGREPVVAPRRVRVQPRQIAAFTEAARLGWTGDVAALVSHGLEYFLSRYKRADGLYRTLIAADGAVADDRVLLYDQAFALLGFARSHSVLGSGLEEARALRGLIQCHFRRRTAQRFENEGAGFESTLDASSPLSSNAHMHLLEASLAWREVDSDPEWGALADAIGELALARFIDRGTGAIRENFASDWTPLPGIEGRILEPGHHFEWAWLLLRWAGEHHADARRSALRLIEVAERHGVREGFAVNALLDDLSTYDASARLWPQTERIKAAALAARMTGEARYESVANDAAEVLSRYLQTPVRGCWYDRWMPYGRFIEEPSPASSFYHIVGAITELTALVSTSTAPS